MAWHFVITTLTGTQVGRVENAYERKLNLALNALSTASFRIRLDNPLAAEITQEYPTTWTATTAYSLREVVTPTTANGHQYIATTAGQSSGSEPTWPTAAGGTVTDGSVVWMEKGTPRGPGDVLLKVYKDSTLYFVGDLMTAEEVGQEGGVSLACNFAGPLWRLTKRMVGKSNAGVSYTATSRGTIIETIVEASDTEWGHGIVMGTVTDLYTVTTDVWRFKPIAEAITELTAIRIIPLEIPGTYTVRDDFDHPGSQVGLYQHNLDNPVELWSTAAGVEDTDDFIVGPGAVGATRATVSDTGPRIPRAGSTVLAATLASVDFKWSALVGAYSGLLARYVDDSNRVYAYVHQHPTIPHVGVVKQTPSGPVEIGRHNLVGSLVTGTYYNLLFQVDADGSFSVWFNLSSTSDKTAGLRIYGQDDDLATGGTLDDGKVGMFDTNLTATPVSREYANFGAMTPTASLVAQDLNFDFDPAEPVSYGTNPDGTTKYKIATLNVVPAVGTSKPNVVMEYGGGVRSLKSYRRVISREGLLNQGYAIGSLDDADIQSKRDTPALTRGLYEEVIPNDLVNASLRQALVESHVDIRKDPREIITFEPMSPAPEFGTDYIVGDTITARCAVDGTVRFNGLFRIYGVEVTIDDEGKETVIPTLVPS